MMEHRGNNPLSALAEERSRAAGDTHSSRRLGCGTTRLVALAATICTAYACSDQRSTVTENRLGAKLRMQVVDTLQAGPDRVAVAVPLVAIRDDRKRFIVADASDKDLKVFSREGAFTKALGRPGEGPGEFRVLIGAALQDEEILALDAIGSRVSVFGSDDTFERSFSLTDESGNPIAMPAGISALDDSLLLVPHAVSPVVSRGLVSIHDRNGKQLKRFFAPRTYFEPPNPELVQNTWVMADGVDGHIWVLLSGARRVSVFEQDGSELASALVAPAGDSASLKTLIEHNEGHLGPNGNSVMDSFESAISLVALSPDMALVQFVRRTDGAVDRLSDGGTLVLLGFANNEIIELDRAETDAFLIGRAGGTALMLKWLGSQFERIEVTSVDAMASP